MLDYVSFAVKDNEKTLKFKQSLIKNFLRQFVVLVVLSLFLSFWCVFFAISFGCGAFIPLVANGIFALVIFKKISNHDATVVMKKFYLGEILKLCFTGICFWLVFQWQSIVATGLFLGFIVAQVLFAVLFAKNG